MEALEGRARTGMALEFGLKQGSLALGTPSLSEGSLGLQRLQGPLLVAVSRASAPWSPEPRGAGGAGGRGCGESTCKTNTSPHPQEVILPKLETNMFSKLSDELFHGFACF